MSDTCKNVIFFCDFRDFLIVKSSIYFRENTIILQRDTLKINMQ